MIDEADMDGDGEVSEAEFLRIMKKTEMFWASTTVNYQDLNVPASLLRFYFSTSESMKFCIKKRAE